MPRNTAQSESARSLAILASVVVVVVAAGALYWARVIFIPLTLAIFLAFILSPAVAILQRRGIGRVPSIILIVGSAVVIAAGVGLVVGTQLVHLTKTLPDHEDKIKAKVTTVKHWISSDENSRLSAFVNDVQKLIDGQKEAVTRDGGPSSKVVVDSSPSWFEQTRGVLTPAAELLGQAVLTFILVVFMLLRREDLRNRVIRLLGEGRVTLTTKAVDETSRRISRYLLAQLLLNTTFGMVIATGLIIMSVPYALLWGFTAFLMRYVPYIGTWISVIPPALFTFAISDGWSLPIGILTLYIGLELITGNFVEPLLYGKHLGLSEVAQLVATAFWAFLWGPIGMILAWPLTTCLLVAGKYLSQSRFLSVLLGDEPVLSPQVAFYQRLAARDQDEADTIVEKELIARSKEGVFDDLLIPTLLNASKEAAQGQLSNEELAFITSSVRDFAENVADPIPEKVDESTSQRVRLILTPVRSPVEQVACELLAHVLEPSLWQIETVSSDFLTAELITRIEESRPAILVLGSLPPGGLTHSRFLCKRIRQKFPDLKIVIGRWAASEELDERARTQLHDAGADEVATSLEETRSILSGWHGVFAASTVAPGSEKTAKLGLVEMNGMASALLTTE
jgi:predicted PurR-regulated permease PerM